MDEFSPTHRIIFSPLDGDRQRVWLVRLDAGADGCGPAYTESEWMAKVPTPEWARIADGPGRWLHKGRRTPGGAPGTVEVIPVWTSRVGTTPKRRKASRANGTAGGRPPREVVAGKWIAMRKIGVLRGISRTVTEFIVGSAKDKALIRDALNCQSIATHPDVLKFNSTP